MRKTHPTAPGYLLKQIRSDGAVSRAALFEQEQLEVGAHVKHMASKKTYAIEALDPDDKLVLNPLDGGDKKECGTGAFLRAVKKMEYRVVPRVSHEQKALADWGKEANPTKTYEWLAMMATARVTLELERLASECKHAQLGELLEFVYAPSSKHGVYAKVDIAQQRLHIPPVTTSISFRESVYGIPKDAVALRTELCAPSGKAMTLALLRPKFQLPQAKQGDRARGIHEKDALQGCVAPFWMISETEDASAANVALHTMPSSSIRVLRNHKAIKAGTKLIRQICKRKTPPTPAQGEPARRGKAAKF